MSRQYYNWKRFWCPRTGIFSLLDGGYLFDPDSEFGHIYNRDVVSFEAISRTPCLVLLGEPGIGKTYALEAEKGNIASKMEAEGGQIIWLDLRSYGSEDRLANDLFKSSTLFSCLKNKQALHIILDSLDECLLRIDNLAALLIDGFRKIPTEHMNLRIACRTADWPSGLENGLMELWGKDAVKVYELVPLRKKDVIEAARLNGLDFDNFLGEIARMEVVPLAIKPVTLAFLINTYQKFGRLPSGKAEIYLRGCELLCEETSESRRDARRTGNLTAKQRLAVAARIAATTIFGNRSAIWTGLDLGDVAEEDIKIENLCTGNEKVDGEEFQLTEAAIKETLDTGLFTSRGANRMGWAHQTYAEFLAARYLIQRNMTVTQMMSLFTHLEDPERKIVPQLHEPAAWLADLVPAVFTEILRTDPAILLRSDVATADLKDRALLAENLLKLFEEEKLLDRYENFHDRYRKLAHPGLANQLRPYISDQNKGLIVRRVAIDIAKACGLKELLDDLIDITLDASNPLKIRTEASYAISQLNGDGSKRKLKPFVTGEAGEDPDDELKGYALQALWPSYITTDELFAALKPPKREHFVGGYQSFLHSDLTKHLKPTDLRTALSWVEKQPPRANLQPSFRGLMDLILLKAWENLTLPDLLTPFAKAALSRLKKDDMVIGERRRAEFEKLSRKNHEIRHQVLEAIISLLMGSGEEAIMLAYTPIVLAEDFLWMIERLKSSPSRKIQEALAQLILRTFDSREPSQFEAAYYASRGNPILAKAFASFLKPIELNSPEAEKFKKAYIRRQESLQNRRHPPLKPPPQERILALLDEFESGNLSAWWHLNMDMTLEPDNIYYGDEIESDLTCLPGWKAAESKTRVRIIDAAKRYVFENNPETSKWLGEDVIFRPAFAGYRALRLLVKEAADFVPTISADIWRKWASIILAYPETAGKGDNNLQGRIIKLAYQHAPEEIIHTLMILIDRENKRHDFLSIIRKINVCWDERLGNALIAKVKDEKLKSGCMGELLDVLLDHKVCEGRSFV